MKLAYLSPNILEIIWATPHGYGTHYATTEHKYKIKRWLQDKHEYTSVHEHHLIWNDAPTFQMMIDLATIILLANDIDPWELAHV